MNASAVNALRQGAGAISAAGVYPSSARRQLREVGPRIVEAGRRLAADDGVRGRKKL